MVPQSNVAGHRLSTPEIESALIMHKGILGTAGKSSTPLIFSYRSTHSTLRVRILVIGTADELTGQAVHAFVTLKP
jgi:acetyl-CoA synthetase